MDPGTVIGLAIGVVGVFVALFLEGGNPAAFILPSPLALIILGTLGVVMASTGLKPTLRIPKLNIKSMTSTTPDRPHAIRTLVGLAERARREGLLALEEEADPIDDQFLTKGLRLVVDGTDPELVKDILDLEVEAMAGRHHENASIFTHAAGFGPTIGIIGTVMGLVHVLGNLLRPELAPGGGFVVYTMFLSGGGKTEPAAVAQANQARLDATAKRKRVKTPIDGPVVSLATPSS